MRYTAFAALVLTATFLFPAPGWAQKARRSTITGARVGFQAALANDGGKEYLFKSGMWAPVSVDISAGTEGLTEGEITVEATDSDDIQNTYTIKIQPYKANTNDIEYSYVRTGSRGGELQIRLQGKNQSDTHKLNFDCMGFNDLLFLSVGTSLPGLRQALIQQHNKMVGNDPAMGGQQCNDGYVARLETLRAMPKHWFAYESVDMMFLTTGDAEFIGNLINDKERHQAILEWVLRGGKLVISAGRNPQLLPSLVPALIEGADSRPPARIKVVPGGLQHTRLVGIERYINNFAPFEGQPGKGDDKPLPIPLAHFERKPGKDVEVLAYDDERGTNPIMVRVPYGTGQIILVAFDLEQPPFTRWEGQPEFWKKLQKDTQLTLQASRQNQMQFGWNHEQVSNDLSGSLYETMQAFPKVSNISFGWVWLFIFVYIIVVGPLDYFFLKKVVKRLELTWITFPSVVLVVSVVSYFTAYALKGNDLLINKADLVDIDVGVDPEGRPVWTSYGQTWFTLFSPRIQHYTIGLEPAAPNWGREPNEEDKASTVLLSWMGRPDDSYGGFGRSRSQSLFRRSYSYAPDATGLEGVPIQVWTEKSFAGSWVRPISQDKPPFVVDDDFGFEVMDNSPRLRGRITNQLPVDLIDVHLIYGGGPDHAGLVFSLTGKLVHDEQKTIAQQGPGRPLQDWLTSGAVQPNPMPGNRTAPPSNKDALFKQILFGAESAGGNRPQNVVLRHLDSTWRLRLDNEVMLFARVATQEGPAENVTQDGITPCRLWLDQLPTPGAKRKPLLGTMTQDTYVRVFLPVKRAKKN
jgi:hypothetical protein